MSYYQDSLNPSVLSTCWGVNYQARGQAIWTFAPSGSTTKSQYLVFDYRFQPGRWARWISYQSGNCLAIMQTSGRKHGLYVGSTDGYVRQLDIADRVVDTSTAYTMTVETPFLNFGSSATLKNAEAGFLSLQPKGDYDANFQYIRDSNAADEVTIDQAGNSNVLG